ncbi:MAG: hypothetical protein RRZ70_03905 [Synergistaceae bacterium]
MSARCAYANGIAVASPWIGEIARFIAKDKIMVRNLSRWDSNGNTVTASYPRNNEIIILLSTKDIKKYRVTQNKNVRVLYDFANMDYGKVRATFYDPAMLPFLAQKTMEIIAETDVKRYSFYQRRLAEFQSRINSTVDVGSHLLSDVHILDLTVSEGAWIQASANKTIKPPLKLWNHWKSGETVSLRDTLNEIRRRKWLVIIDPWTPDEIKNIAKTYDNCILLPSPKNDADFFAYLYDMLLAVNNKKNIICK